MARIVGGMDKWSLAAGTLPVSPVSQRYDLVAEPVAKALRETDPADLDQVGVVEIDPELADTADFCQRYESPLERSANCVVVAGKRSGELRYAACLVLATTRTDVNGIVKRRLDVRKASFAPMADAVSLTGMEYGGITAFGLPEGWPLLVDQAVADADVVVVGSGSRHSKLLVPGEVLTRLPAAEVVSGLGQ